MNCTEILLEPTDEVESAISDAIKATKLTFTLRRSAKPAHAYGPSESDQ